LTLFSPSLLLEEVMKLDGSEAQEVGECSPSPAPSPALSAVRGDPMRPFVQAARRGDAVAIDHIVTFLTAPLLKAARALMGPENPDVEDVVQEVLMGVIDALPSFREECTVLHFAIRITIRRTTAARRRSRWILEWLKRMRRGEEPLAPPPASPCEATVAERRRELLRKLLRDMPETQAETLMLRLALGHSIEEIASITNAPLNTVRSRLRLAKETLRSRIGNDPRWAELSEVPS
jgi:RNA polymerase sigma-70 factor (ECF subfamily)